MSGAPELPGYRLERVIGRGGMGTVHRAWHVELERWVAVKTLAAALSGDPVFRERFVRESRLAASLAHPHVIPVYDAGRHEGMLYIVMRLVEGPSVADVLERDGALDPARARSIAIQAAGALEAAHHRGLVHRDVKPANLLLEGDHLFLADFGLAVGPASSALTGSGEWIGSLDYAAPEQIRGEPADARADVYALGCVLYAMLSGRPPFAGRTDPAKAAAHLHETPPPLAGPLGAAVARALAKDPADRQPSAAAFAAELPPASPDAATRPAAVALTRRRPRPSTSSAPRRRQRWPAVAVGVGVLAAALAAAVLLSTGGRSAHPRPVTRAPAPSAPSGPVAALGAQGSVRCAAGRCTQGARTVIAPIEGGPCALGATAGSWTRVDAAAPEPLLLCEPAGRSPRMLLAAVPDLTGARLDHAEEALDRLGVPYQTSGGGLLGILDAGNWTVCTTTPSPQAPLTPRIRVRLFVDRRC